MNTGLVYILAASHSGSTLLAMLLGSHPKTCTVGELKATSLGDPGEYLCSCGQRIRECTFWCEVHERMKQRGVAFDITDARTDIRHGAGWYTGRLLKPLCRRPGWERLRDAALAISPAWRRTLPEVQRRNLYLVETLREMHDAELVVDSSKIGLRLKYLLRIPELDIKVVRLIRDGRAVALTYMSPDEFADAREPGVRCGGSGRTRQGKGSMVTAAREWLRSNEEAECVLECVDESQWIEVRYEELCADPNRTLETAFRFLGLDPGQRLDSFRQRAGHVVGNGMRFDTTSEIRLDDRWQSVLTPAELKEFDSVAGPMNRRYGYG